MMKKLIYNWCCLISIFFSEKISSQQIAWNHINSTNIVGLIASQNPDTGTFTSTIQLGDYNKADLYLNNKTSISLQQIGDYNSLFFNNSFSEKGVVNNITTQGNNNIIDITGGNSISEKLRLNLKGDNMTVFIRNY